jgi:hypothetical protein
MQSVQSYKRRAVSEKSRVEKGSSEERKQEAQSVKEAVQ